MIGINNIRSNSLVLAPLDRDFMKEALDSIFSTHKLIQGKFFFKHTPDSAYSPCKDCYGKPCPFLEHCWPETFRKLNIDSN